MTTEDKFVVLIAVDKSGQAQYAFEFYAANIHRPGNKVYLVHIPEGPTTTTAARKHPDIALQEWQKLMEKEQIEMETMCRIFQSKLDDAKINGSYKTFYGKPGEALCEAALELKANIVVMGTRGHGTVRRTILGSVSDYLIHHAHVPVIVCRR